MTPERIVAGCLGLGLLVLAARRPDRSLLVLIVLLPFHGLILAWLWSLGVPSAVVRHLAAWKEVLALGIVIAGARGFIVSRRRPDRLDGLAALFVLAIAVYALLGPQIVPGAPASRSVRLLGFRETAGFVLVLLGARHALGPGFSARAAPVVFAAGVIVAAVAIFEVLFPSSWNHFVVHTLRYTRYEAVVGHAPDATPNSIITQVLIVKQNSVRPGSVFLDPLVAPWYLVLPLAIGVEQFIRRRARLPTVAATVVLGLVIILTQTRSAMLAGATVGVLALTRSAGREGRWRARAGMMIAGFAVVGVPIALAAGAIQRVQQISNGSDMSSPAHLARMEEGLTTLVHHPLGRGLGTAAGIGARFSVHGAVVPENTYLNVGVQAGVAVMLLFIALNVQLIVLLRRQVLASGDPTVTAVWSALTGIALGALFLDPWLSFPVAWTLWPMAASVLVSPARAAFTTRSPQRVAADEQRACAPWTPRRWLSRPRRAPAGLG